MDRIRPARYGPEEPLHRGQWTEEGPGLTPGHSPFQGGPPSGVILSSQTPRFLPWFKAIAGFTIFIFTITTIIPSSFASSSSQNQETLRNLSPDEAPGVHSGLEENLLGEASRLGLSRRSFLRAGAGAMTGLTLLELLNDLSRLEAAPPGLIRSPEDFLIRQKSARNVAVIVREKGEYVSRVFFRDDWATHLPISYSFDKAGNEGFAAAIEREIEVQVKATGRTRKEIQPEVEERFRIGLRRLTGRSFTYATAASVIGLVSAAEAATNADRKKELLAHAREILEALVRLEQGTGKIGYAYVVASPSARDRERGIQVLGEHDTSLQMGTLAWVGEAFLQYQRVSGDTRPFVYAKNERDRRTAVQVAEDLGQTLLGYQGQGVAYRTPEGKVVRVRDTGLVPMGTRGGKSVYWGSTEYNVDAYFFLRDLGLASKKPAYTEASQRIASGMLAKEHGLFDDTRKRFRRGYRDEYQVLDANSWGAIFLLAQEGREADAKAVLDYLHKNFRREIPTGAAPLIGYPPYIRDQFIWSEGTGGVALLERRLGNTDAADGLVTSMRRLVTPAGGIRDAYPAGWTLSEDKNLHLPYGAVAAAAWVPIANSGGFWSPKGGLEEAAAVQGAQSSLQVQRTAAGVQVLVAENFWKRRSDPEPQTAAASGAVEDQPASASQLQAGVPSEEPETEQPATEVKDEPRMILPIRPADQDDGLASESFYEEQGAVVEALELDRQRVRSIISAIMNGNYSSYLPRREEGFGALFSLSVSPEFLSEDQLLQRLFERNADGEFVNLDGIEAFLADHGYFDALDRQRGVEQDERRLQSDWRGLKRRERREELARIADRQVERMREATLEFAQTAAVWAENLPDEEDLVSAESWEALGAVLFAQLQPEAVRELADTMVASTERAPATISIAQVEPDSGAPAAPSVQLPEPQRVWSQRGRARSHKRRVSQLESWVSWAAQTQDLQALQQFAKDLSLDAELQDLETLRARVIDGMARLYKFDDQQWLRDENSDRLEAKNQLRQAAGLTTLEVERSWESNGYILYQAFSGNQAVKTVIVARAEEDGLMGMSESALAQLTSLHQDEGVDVTVLTLGRHSPEAFALNYAQQVASTNSTDGEAYLRSQTPPELQAHQEGYVTFVAPGEELDVLEVEHTTDPLIAWVKHRHGGQAAVDAALSLESSEHFRLARLGAGQPESLETGELFLADNQVQDGVAERRGIDFRLAEAEEAARQDRSGLVKVAAMLVGTAFIAGVGAPDVSAQDDVTSQLMTTGTDASQPPVVLRPFNPQVSVDMAIGEGPIRVQPQLSEADKTDGPPLVAKIAIQTPADKKAALRTTTTQTRVPRVLTSPANFSREPKATATGRLTQKMAGLRSWLRTKVFGEEKPEEWKAATEPTKAMVVPQAQVGYTLWNPERLEDLGEDQIEALFASIGKGAKAQKTRPSILYEINWPVTLSNSQREEGPVAEAVLIKVRRHIQLAHKYGIAVVPVYSGTEALADPAAAVQQLDLALQMGFDQGAIVTDIEPWAIPADQPQGEWQRAQLELQDAMARGDDAGASQARQKLLQLAVGWRHAHEEILRRNIPADRAYPDYLGGAPQVHAFVQPAFVPVLKLAAQWDQVSRAASGLGLNVHEIWKTFDSVTAAGNNWTEADLLTALEAKGLKLEASALSVSLPGRMKLVCMCYSYPDGNEAEAVTAQMQLAHAGGFGGKMGVAVNLEPGQGNTSLADRSGRAGEITVEIVQALQAEPSTGYDGSTVYVHVADELALVDMTKDGELSWPRQVTAKRTQGISDALSTAVSRTFGIPARRTEEQHRVPGDESVREFAQRQAVTALWGLGGGILGIEPWYATEENIDNWIAKDIHSIHPGLAPLGPEAGTGQRVAALALGAIASGDVQVTDMNIRLIKRGAKGEIIRDVTVRHIPGRNSPVISDDVWDEAELEVTVRRVGSTGMRLLVDMAAKVENRDVATSATPREEWTNTTMMPWETTASFKVPLPQLVAGSNNITLLTHDNQGRIVQWLGPSQNTNYLAPYAPLIADQAADRLASARVDLTQRRADLGAKPGQRLTNSQLMDPAHGERLDLIPDQQALGLNPLSLRTGARAEFSVREVLGDKYDMDQADSLLGELKFGGVDTVIVRVPELEELARKSLSSSDVGLGAGRLSVSKLMDNPFAQQLVQFIQHAHRHGVRVHLSLEADSLLQAAKALEGETQGTQKPRDSQMLAGELLQMILMANEIGHWNIDAIAFDQPSQNTAERRLIERIVREGLDTSIVITGPSGESSLLSQYVQTIPMGTHAAVLGRVDQVLGQPQTVNPSDYRYAHRHSRAMVLESASLADAAKWFRGLPTVESSPPGQAALWPVDPASLGGTPEGQAMAGQVALLNRLRVPDTQTLSRLGYAPSVIQQVQQKAPTVTQAELSEALGHNDPDKEPETWAVAMVQAKAEEVKTISELPQVERYGTTFDNAMLSLYGIQLTPLIMTEAQRAEVTPLTPMHIQQQGGTAWLGVQVTNPADPDQVKSPAVYDVYVHVDYPSWTSRPSSVHKTMTMILKPGETAPAWVELQGLPSGEDSRAVRLRVIPRGAEEHMPGQLGTRTDAEQVLELQGFVIHGKPIPGDDVGRHLDEAFDQFMARWEHWKKVYGITEADPNHMDLFEEHLNTHFGVGTDGQWADVTIVRDPASGDIVEINLTPPKGVRATAAAQAAKARDVINKWRTERITRVQAQPERWGVTLMTWVYTTLGTIAMAVIPVAYVLGMANGYRRANLATQHRRHQQRGAARLGPAGSIIPYPPTGSSQMVSVTDEEVILVSGPLGGNFSSRPAQVQSGQRQSITAMQSYSKHGVVVLDDKTEEMSENIQRSPADALSGRRPGRPAPTAKEYRSLFHRFAPRLMGLTILLGIGAFLMATTLGWAVVGVAAAIWVGLFFSQALRTVAGFLIAAPVRVAGSRGLNHPVTILGIGVAAVVGALALALTLGIPLVALVPVVGLWGLLAIILGVPTADRIPGALGIAGVGTIILMALLAMTLPVWWWVALSVATVLITQRILMNWLEAELPMQGLLVGLWQAAHFVVKWGLIAAAIYGVFWVLHPLLWGVIGTWLTTAVTLPVLGTLIPTIGALIVAIVLVLNVLWQSYLLYNLLTKRAAPRRDGLSFVMLSFGIPAFILATFWIWGVPAAAAVWVYLWLTVLVVHGVALLWMGLETLSRQWSRLFEWRDGVEQRLAPDERVLLYENGAVPTDADLNEWLGAWGDAVADATQRQRQGTGSLRAPPALGGATVGDRATQLEQALQALPAAQRRLVNLHLWKRRSIKQAKDAPGFNGLSAEDQQFLVRHHFNRYVLAHLDTVFSGDLGGTLFRSTGYGWWTATMNRFVRRMRNDDSLVAIMPALLLSIAWEPGSMGDPWGRIRKGQVWLIGWEGFRTVLASVTAPLGFVASMANRNLRAHFTHDSNMLAPIELRADAGIGGYVEPVEYVIHVMGRWMVGHIFVLMRAYLGRQITRSAADRLGIQRWQRKDGSVRDRIERLKQEARDALAAGDPPLYRRKMAAAHYASLTGGRNVTFDLGESPPPKPHKEADFSRASGKAGVDPVTDDTRMPPELDSGTLAGTIGQRLSKPEFHLPIRVELISRYTDEDGMVVDLLTSGDVSRMSSGRLRLVRLSEGEQAILNEKVAEMDGAVEAAVEDLRKMSSEQLKEEVERLEKEEKQLEEKSDPVPEDLKVKIKKGQNLIKFRQSLLGKVIKLSDGKWAYQDASGIGHRGSAVLPSGSLVWQLAPDPGRVNFGLSHGNVKARGADTGFQILEGRFSAEVEVVPLAAPGAAGETHELKVSVRSEEDHAFPELAGNREAIEDPRDRNKGKKTKEGRAAAHAMAVRTHERRTGAALGSDEDARAVSPVELGNDLYKDRQGLWYQLRLNFFGWLRARYLGMDRDGNPKAWRAAVWWLATLALAVFVVWISGWVALGSGLVIVPWIMAILFGTLIPLSFIGLGIQDTVLQGMKAHYEGKFLKKAMNGFFEGTPAAGATNNGLTVATYRDRLREGWDIARSDDTLRRLVEIYPSLMHPEDDQYKQLWHHQADPAQVATLRALLGDPNIPTDRYGLRRHVKREILRRVQAEIGNDAEKWAAFREALTRNTQLELAAVGNETAGIQYHRSRNWDVFRGGDVNRQFAVEGQGPLEQAMKDLGVPVKRLRSWAFISQGAFFGGVRMPSDMSGGGAWVSPLQAFLDGAPADQTVNQFMLEHTHLQPATEATNEFLQEESVELVKALNVAGMTVAQADAALATRENRLGLAPGTFVRFATLGWSDAKLQQKLKSLQDKVQEDKGDISLSAAKPPPKALGRALMGLRWWAIAIGLIGGFFYPPLFGFLVVPAWFLGLQFVRTGFASLYRWVQPQVLKKAIVSWKEPYSDEVILLSLLSGVKKDQVVSAGNQVVDLKWSALDGLYDPSRWRLALGTYLFPGTPIGKLPLWERGGAMVHATPVPLIAALRLLEEPPWLAGASGFNRLPTNAFEIGESFAEDTLFGLVNLHRPTLNPTANALNAHKLDYLFGQEELRKRDQGTLRAVQLFKGIGMAESVKHMFDHPMLAGYRGSDAGKTVQRIFGWDSDAGNPSGMSIFGMEAFRMDEVATAGSRGAGTLSYGYSGFTGSDLFGRRVGPFAPGEVAAYWKYQEYDQLDQLWGGTAVDGQSGLFFKTLRSIQKRHQPGLDAQTSREALLGGLVVDPWMVLAEAGAAIAEEQDKVAAPINRAAAITSATASVALAGLEERPAVTEETSSESPVSWSSPVAFPEEEPVPVTVALPDLDLRLADESADQITEPAAAVITELPPAVATEGTATVTADLAQAQLLVRTEFQKLVPMLSTTAVGIGPSQVQANWGDMESLAAIAHLLPDPIRQRLFVVTPDSTRGQWLSRAGLNASSEPVVVVDKLSQTIVGQGTILEYYATATEQAGLEEAVLLLGAPMEVRQPAQVQEEGTGFKSWLKGLVGNLISVPERSVGSYVSWDRLIRAIEIIVGT